MKQRVGFRYVDYRYDEQMVWGFNKINGIEHYIVNDPNKGDDRVYGDLISEDEMDTLISKQDEFKKGIALRLQRQEEYRLKELQEQKKQRELEFLYGFDDKFTPLQRGKVLKCLMKRFNYDGVVMTRKEFIIASVREGCEFKQKTFGQPNKRAKNDTVTIYGAFYPNSNIFTEITKTECDFANYLIDTGVVT